MTSKHWCPNSASLRLVHRASHRWRVRGTVQVTSVDVGPEEEGVL